MGTIQHHVILITCYYSNVMAKWLKAHEIFEDAIISEVQGPTENYYYSFAIYLDGSKEWWPDSDSGDTRRERFIACLEDVDWCEVEYGELGYTARGKENEREETTTISD